MDRHFRLSRYRFASAMSSIVNKFNFPFEDDTVVSIKTLTYDTHNGPKVWGEEPSDEVLDISYENNIQHQESIEVQKQNSDFEEDYTDDQSFEEDDFTNLHEESQFSPGNERNAKLASIKWHLANIHIKENIPLECSSETPVKNKCKVEMDMLLEDCASSVPTTLMTTRTKPRSIPQLSPLQEMENKSLIGYDMVQRKQLSSVSPRSPELFNSATSHPGHGIIVPKNHSLCANNETVHSSFLEMYESADENCSWNNVTIADLYPGMVKTLSRLLHKVSHTASSNSLNKRSKYGYWHSKKTKYNTSTERARKSRVLKLKPRFITENDEKKHKLSIGNNGHNNPFYNCKDQIQCSEKSIPRIESTVSQNSDRMEIDCSGIAEDNSYSERTGISITETTIFPKTLYTEKAFLVKSTCFPLSPDSVQKKQSFKECSSTICTVDSGTTCNPLTEGKTGELSTMAFKTTSCLSLSLNNSTNSVLQSTKSPVKISDGLQRNHEIKTFTATVSLPRSHSFSSFHVNRSPISVHHKYEDAFENIYTELCSPKLQKPLKFSDIYTSPRSTHSAEVHISGLNNLSSNFHQKTNNMIEDIYQKLCSEGFPKIPTFLRAANLKKYEGMQISETVNALVNSPIRTVPAVARIKRAAHFCSEDSQSSPLKRLKNKSGNSYRVCQKLPCWKSIKSNATFTLDSPVKNSWASNMNYGFSVSSDHSFLATSIADMEESRIADINEKIPKCLQSCDFPRKSQHYVPKVFRKLSYNDGRIRSKELI